MAIEIVGRHLTTVPVDLSAMARDLGVAVVTEPLPDDISGKIERDWMDDFVITLNAGHSSTRRRFTLAHEIAHFVMHRDLIGDGITDNALYRDARLGDERERQANRYAATLLMPPDLVKKVWNEGVFTAEGMAARFDVSPAVAEIRMRELGCVLWKKPAILELPF